MCCLRGRTSVSLWMWGIGVVCEQPVAIRSAIFCVMCSLFMCVVAVSVCHAGLAYVSMGLMYCLYTRVMSSLDWPGCEVAGGVGVCRMRAGHRVVLCLKI